MRIALLAETDGKERGRAFVGKNNCASKEAPANSARRMQKIFLSTRSITVIPPKKPIGLLYERKWGDMKKFYPYGFSSGFAQK